MADRGRGWAVVRLALGLGQVMGATVSLYLLLQTGMNDLTLGAIVVTCAVTAVSVLLFRGRKGR